MWLLLQLGQLGGVDANGFHVIKNKVDLSELRGHGRAEVLFDGLQDHLRSGLLREVVPAGEQSQ